MLGDTDWNNALADGEPFEAPLFAPLFARCGRRDKRRPICGGMPDCVGWNNVLAGGVPRGGHPFVWLCA